MSRVKIDMVSGLVELEGQADFVSTYLDKLLPMIEASLLRTERDSDNQMPTESVEPSSSDSPNLANGAGETLKKKRKVPKRPPAGSSCRDRILILKGDGFFKEHRTTSAIVGGLAKKGWTHTVNQVGASLTKMFNNGEIQRTRSDEGNSFSYFWDRH